MKPNPTWRGEYVQGNTARPETCGTFKQAHKAAKLHEGGVGILLGVQKGGHSLCGIDIDSCIRTRADGHKVIEPWASSVLARFNSYTEISPSGTGVKIFFLAKSEGKKNVTSKCEGSNGKHPAAVDIFFKGKYFTVTGQSYSSYSELRIVSDEDYNWLINEFMPIFEGRNKKHKQKSNMKGVIILTKQKTGKR
jgi:hypothetical protein